MDQDTIMALVRHALTVGGGALVTGGYINDGQLQTVIGGVIVVAGVVWSLIQKRQQKAAVAAAASTGVVK